LLAVFSGITDNSKPFLNGMIINLLYALSLLSYDESRHGHLLVSQNTTITN